MRQTSPPVDSTRAFLLAALLIAGCADPLDEVFLIPAGYVGPVVVDYDRRDGAPPTMSGDTLIYTISDRGWLYTTNKIPDGWHQMRYEYIDNDGRRSALLPANEFIHPPEKVVYFGESYAGGQSPHEGRVTKSFLVGPYADRDSLFAVLEKRR